MEKVTGRPKIRKVEYTKYTLDMPLEKKEKLQKKLKELSEKEGKLFWEIICERVMEG